MNQGEPVLPSAASREPKEGTQTEASVLRFLTVVGERLVESLDYETTLAETARLAVPFLADWCVVDVVEGDGARNRLSAAHVDPQKARLLWELRERYPLSWHEGHPVERVMASRSPMHIPEVTEQVLERYARGEDYKQMLRDLGTRSALVLPLMARGRVLGAITLVSASVNRYGPREQLAASEFARFASLTLDNARLYREAKDAVRARDDFLALASHELYTPITSLKLSLQFALRSGEAPAEAARRRLETTARQVDWLIRLADEMLDVSKLMRGHLALHLGSVDLAAVAREMVENSTAELQRAGSPLSLEADEAVVGRWDLTKVEQIVTNLLSNAVKFGAGAAIELKVETHGDFARLTVRDHGLGMDAEGLPDVFGPFVRGVPSAHFGGLGLGLYIVKEFTSALGGAVRVESVPRKGSTFTVELPLAGPPA